MAPPSFADLGKAARDLFSKNYSFGQVKLDVKTKTAKKVEFTMSGVSINETGLVNASLETKCYSEKLGCTLKEKLTTDNTILSELTFEDKVMQGSKLVLSASFAPQSGKKSGAIKSTMKSDSFHANADLDFDALNSRTMAHGAVVFGHQGLVGGAQVSFNPQQAKLTKTNISLGYLDKEFQVHTNVCDGKEFLGSFYQKIDSKLDTAMSVSCAAGSNSPLFTVGCLYRLDQDTQVKARVNNKTQVGVAFIHKLSPKVTLTLNALIDAKNFNQGGHKLGMGLDFTP